ncbi:hypothetical protein E2P84_22955 [Burkholderia cepacia]|uniref:Uncharacterized protein n=1 Tax=Burkholderia cepacia TaxID=292 RepID=A0AAX2RRQ8_BURCE|nr:hypothetical protein [Burkholderia cepacia]TES72992.1 hypothetical protein E2P84_22955 [Burkholderia cepacia]TET04387.1 hypothetical protein E3D36_05435 [Burkholderia cepacia]TEU41974.1 hypothetical protein E3D39_16425 [Burkholderia cepacia]TEU46617.1 hypothetical protein E3D38_24860 [Burkholderia cepacia]TEU48647.1 hypothetical protein E3D37_14790 [Burkholderia cepacia]
MKHGNGIRFATTGPASRRNGRVRARAASAPFVVARACLPSGFAAAFAAAPVANAAAARPAGNHSPAASAATFARAIASGRAARSMPLPLAKRRPAALRRRSLSSVRLTLMQDHSS